jgi:hypothetical protein
MRRVRASSAAFFCAAFRVLAFCAALLLLGAFFLVDDVLFLGWVCAERSNVATPRDATKMKPNTIADHRMRDTDVVYCGKSLPSVDGSLSAKILITSALKYPALAAAVDP